MVENGVVELIQMKANGGEQWCAEDGCKRRWGFKFFCVCVCEREREWGEGVSGRLCSIRLGEKVGVGLQKVYQLVYLYI